MRRRGSVILFGPVSLKPRGLGGPSSKSRRSPRTDAWRDAHGSLEGFFTSPSFFDKLAGTDVLRRALEAGYDLTDLERMWRADHRTFFEAAQPHLLYSWNAPLPGR